MLMNGTNILACCVLAIAMGRPSASETQKEPTAELLPDGNLRDRAPGEDELAQLVAATKKNLVHFAGGIFWMGDWGSEVNEGGMPFDGERDSKPLHQVRLDPFAIGKFPVTYREFDLFTAARRLPRINQQRVMQNYRKPENPAGASWEGARDYCSWLKELSGQPFSLPTEAQWEYAARSGGKRYVYPTNNGKYEPGRNLPSFEQREAAGGLTAVDSFPPNPAGLYYLGAGVNEWTSDWYDPNYYPQSPRDNPQGPERGSKRVVRGFYGNGGSEMTFKRWSREPKERTGTWTKFGKTSTDQDQQVPHTKYSHFYGTAFRCILATTSDNTKFLPSERQN